MPVTVNASANWTPAANAVVRSAAAIDQLLSAAVSVFVVAPVIAVVYAVNAAASDPVAISVTVRAPVKCTLAAKAVVKSAALTNDVNLIPYIGIENGDAAAAVLNVHYTAISRHVYE